eukprot:CAMPEP_0119011080 /NCGR_PEP_ID=MMETSP1176-20130426/5447_1 /TAXON_ID=265551 /ORGANISM="Synedropsis recta cf, Strain CCMP1620" /LENGTH=104 /DNA_ID=CAMNT_0006963851 /DNA_START=44 /DNA_END=358 /DNA_ORIENTATION=-
MALSMLNYFFWENEDAKIPFICADVVVIVALHFVEKGMKKQTALKEMQEKGAINKKHEDDKMTKASTKSAQRDEQKRAQQRQKSAPKGSTAHLSRQINKPDKTK